MYLLKTCDRYKPQETQIIRLIENTQFLAPFGNYKDEFIIDVGNQDNVKFGLYTTDTVMLFTTDLMTVRLIVANSSVIHYQKYHIN